MTKMGKNDKNGVCDFIFVIGDIFSFYKGLSSNSVYIMPIYAIYYYTMTKMT